MCYHIYSLYLFMLLFIECLFSPAFYGRWALTKVARGWRHPWWCRNHSSWSPTVDNHSTASTAVARRSTTRSDETSSHVWRHSSH